MTIRVSLADTATRERPQTGPPTAYGYGCSLYATSDPTFKSERLEIEHNATVTMC